MERRFSKPPAFSRAEGPLLQTEILFMALRPNALPEVWRTSSPLYAPKGPVSVALRPNAWPEVWRTSSPLHAHLLTPSGLAADYFSKSFGLPDCRDDLLLDCRADLWRGGSPNLRHFLGPKGPLLQTEILFMALRPNALPEVWRTSSPLHAPKGPVAVALRPNAWPEVWRTSSPLYAPKGPVSVALRPNAWPEVWRTSSPLHARMTGHSLSRVVRGKASMKEPGVALRISTPAAAA